MCRLSQNIILNAKYWYVKLGTLLCNTCGNLFIYIIRSRIIGQYDLCSCVIIYDDVKHNY